jgi:hypothetical protein
MSDAYCLLLTIHIFAASQLVAMYVGSRGKLVYDFTPDPGNDVVCVWSAVASVWGGSVSVRKIMTGVRNGRPRGYHEFGLEARS